MENKTQGLTVSIAAILVVLSALWNPPISIMLAIVTLIFIAVIRYKKSKKNYHDDMSGSPLGPVQMQQRRESLDKIMSMAASRPRITIVDVQNLLRVSDVTATRYLEYLVNLNKLNRTAERGQQVYYQLPNA